MKSSIALMICASLLSLSGCTSATPPSDFRGPSGAVSRNGVKVTLKLDHTVYKPGELVWADVLVENTGSAPVLWIGGGCGLPAHVYVKAPSSPGAAAADNDAARLEQLWQQQYRRDELQFFTDEGALAIQQKGLTPTCAAAVADVELKPGAALRYRGAWDQQLDFYPNKVLASPGRYIVEAVFPMGGMKAQDPLTAQVALELGGNRPKLVDRMQALDAALADARVTDWVRAHSGDGVARQENGQWLIRDGDKWIRSGTELGRSEAAGTPLGSAAYQDGKWIVHLARSSGPIPHVVDTTVNAETGKIESVTFTTQGK